MTQRNTEARRQMLAARRQRQRSLTGGMVIVTEKTPWGQIRAHQFPLPPRKPSRNDSAEYRGIGGAGPVRQQALAR